MFESVLGDEETYGHTWVTHTSLDTSLTLLILIT